MTDSGGNTTDCQCEPPWQHLLDYAELMSKSGHYKKAADAAWKVRSMIYAHQGVNDDAYKQLSAAGS